MGSSLTKQQWVPFRIGDEIPENAVIGGFNKSEMIYIGRVCHGSGGMVAYYELQKKAIVHHRDKPENIYCNFEILTGSGQIWLSTIDFQIPQGAISFGINANGQNLYIGRGKGIDRRNQNRQSCLVVVNSSAKSIKILDMNRNLRPINSSIQLLIEAPTEIKFLSTSSKLRSVMSYFDTNKKPISKYIMDHMETGLGLIAHNARYYTKEFKVSNPPSKPRNADDEKMCCICLATDKDTLFLPCRHICCCFECANEQKNMSGKCPVCRQNVTQVIKVYL